MDFLWWFTTTASPLVIDLPTIRPPMERFSTTFLNTVMLNSTEKDHIYDHLNMPEKNSYTTSSLATTTTKMITSDMNNDVLRPVNYTGILQTFLTELIEKKQRDLYMIVIFFLIIVLCLSIIITFVLIIIMKYHQTNRSSKGELLSCFFHSRTHKSIIDQQFCFHKNAHQYNYEMNKGKTHQFDYNC